MSDMSLGNLKKFGAELNVSEKFSKITKVSVEGRSLHKTVYDIRPMQYGFIFDDGRYKHFLQAAQELAIV